MNYGFDVNMKDPQLVQWAQQVNARNDAKAKESRDNMMNLLKVAGLAGAAYKGGNGMTQSAEDYYNNNWAEYSPEDQLSLLNLGFNPSLYNSMNLNNMGNYESLDSDGWAVNDWGM